jgi:hypothetical protein
MTETTEAPVRRGRPPGSRNAARDAVHQNARLGPREFEGRDGEVLTRTRKSGLDPFHVPKNFPPEGWEYQWCAVAAVGNKEVMRTQNIEFFQNGWRPVPAKRHDGYFLPKGEEGPIVVRDQMLMERPSEMCDDARNEDKRNAIQQMRDRDESLMGGKANLKAAMRDGIEMGGKYRGTGGNLRMSIDPALDIPMPSHKLAEPGE